MLIMIFIVFYYSSTSSVLTAKQSISDIDTKDSYQTTSYTDTQNNNEAISDTDMATNTLFTPDTEYEVINTPTDLEPVNVSNTPSVNIMMVGDILLHTPVEEAACTDSGSYDFGAIFTNTKDIISSADLALVNQEVIIGGKELGVSGYPCFNAPEEIADALVDSGFDVICHGTNHALDKGKKGIINTLSNWKNKYPGIITLGIYDNQEDYETVTVTEVNGIKIALLNYTYGTNGISIPSDMPYCVDLMTKEKVIKDLDTAEKEADFTIICPHWGTEYSLEHSKEQEEWCKIFLEHGADLVIGTHPHVIQDIQYYSDDNSEMLVYYSLGNFVNWTSGTGEGVANRMVGGIADVEISKNISGKAYIESYDVIPVVCHVESRQNGVTVYPLSEYNESLASKNEIQYQDSSFSLNYCINLIKDIWEDNCSFLLENAG